MLDPTDGSLLGYHVASATVCGTTTKTIRLPNGVSIFRSVLYAITKTAAYVTVTQEHWYSSRTIR